MSTNDPAEMTQRKQMMAGIFDRAAATYDQVGPRFFSHFGRRLVEIAQIPIGANVLDAATGRGAVLFPAAEAVGPQGHVIGIDFSESMVQETTRELAQRNAPAKIEVRQMDAEHLQFPDETFDDVLCGFAIFFFPQLDLAMSEFRRVLKPNGRICVSTWDKVFSDNWNWFFAIAKTVLPPAPAGNQNKAPGSIAQPVFDTPQGLEAIVQAAGFRDIQISSELTEYVYTTLDEFWSTLWSHGMRATLERIEQAAGADGLQHFKEEVFKQASVLHQTGSLREQSQAIFALAAK